MVHYKKVVQGIANYVDDEIISKFTGSWKAWVLGTAATLITARADAVFQTLKDNAALKALGLIDGENIDVETVYAEMLKQAQKSSATISLPVIGPVTFGVGDIEAIYRHIVGV